MPDVRDTLTIQGVLVVTEGRQLTTLPPLTGGGALSADHTIGLSYDTTLHVSGGVLGVSSAVALAGHTHSFADLTARPTTLAGYGITDAASSALLDAHTTNTANPHSVTADQAGAVAKSGDTMIGPLWMPSQSGVNDIAGYAIFILDGAAGTYRELRYTTNGSPRWRFRVNNTAESGGNAGSNFQISSHDDDGNYLSSPLTIIRATGDATFTAALKAATFETSAGSQWQLAGYTAAGDAVSNGYVTVTINGVTRKLMTRA